MTMENGTMRQIKAYALMTVFVAAIGAMILLGIAWEIGRAVAVWKFIFG